MQCVTVEQRGLVFHVEGLAQNALAAREMHDASHIKIFLEAMRRRPTFTLYPGLAALIIDKANYVPRALPLTVPGRSTVIYVALCSDRGPVQ